MKATHQGTCQICGRTGLKVAGGKMSHHGYTRPGVGYDVANCYGERKLAWELDKSVAEEYLGRLRDSLTAVRRDAARVEAGEFLPFQMKVYTQRQHRMFGGPSSSIVTVTEENHATLDRFTSPRYGNEHGMTPRERAMKMNLERLQAEGGGLMVEIKMFEDRLPLWEKKDLLPL